MLNGKLKQWNKEVFAVWESKKYIEREVEEIGRIEEELSKELIGKMALLHNEFEVFFFWHEKTSWR